MIARAALVAVLLVAPAAHGTTDPAPSTPPAPCVVQGPLLGNTTIYDLAKSGQPIATITGGSRWVRVSEFPAHAPRLRLVSGKSTPTLRVEGFADVDAVPIGLAKDRSVVGQVLSIRATVPLRVTEIGSALSVEPRNPTFEGIRASVACSDLQIVREKSPPSLPPASAVLLAVHKSLELFGGAGGAPLTTLRIADADAGLHAYETLNGFVHVRFAADVLIDGWMRRSALTEKMSTSATCGLPINLLGGWGTTAPPVFAQRDTEVRLGPQGPRVGVLEKGTRAYRWGSASGAWAPIRVLDGDAREPDGKLFHVNESDLAASP